MSNRILNTRPKLEMLKKRHRRLVWLMLLLICSSAQVCRAQNHHDSIVQLIKQYDNGKSFSGIIMVASDSEGMTRFTYGFRNLEKGDSAISIDDNFFLASLTKQFTGFAIIKLICEGKLSQEDLIGKYIPELKPALQGVTLRQLANHTNGIHDFYSLTDRSDTLNGDGVFHILTNLDSTVFKPGTKWGYSNSGYFLLSVIIERVTGKPFRDYMEQIIFSELGMNYSCMGNSCKNTLKGYDASGKHVTYPDLVSGESGMCASANDILNYFKKISSDEGTLKEYFSLARKWSDPSNTDGWNYGYGWYFSEDEKGKFRAHSGRNPGAETYIKWYDNDDFMILILSNVNSPSFKSFREAICKQLLDQ